MKLKKMVRLAVLQIVSRSITVGVTLVAAAVVTLGIMCALVTIATVFELRLPYRVIAGMVALVALALITGSDTIRKRNEKARDSGPRLSSPSRLSRGRTV